MVLCCHSHQISWITAVPVRCPPQVSTNSYRASLGIQTEQYFAIRSIVLTHNTSFVHHKITRAELVVVQMMDRDQLIGADVCLHGAILPHHVSWSHRGHHLHSNPGSTERQWVTKGNIRDQDGPQQQKGTWISRLGSKSGNPMQRPWMQLHSRLCFDGFSTPAGVTLPKEDRLPRELLLTLLLFLWRQINIY